MRHLFIITTIAATLALITACSSDSTTETETAVTTDADTTAVFIMQLQRCSKLYKRQLPAGILPAEYDIRKIVTHSDEKRLKGKIFNRDFDVKMPLGDRKIAIPIDVKLKAYIDFADFSETNVVRSGEKIEVFLPDPHVVLTSSKVNHDDIREYVDFTRSRFSDAELTDYERQGREAVIKSIPQLGILHTAQENAAQVIVPMVVKMGYKEENITVTFRKDYRWQVEMVKD